MTRRSSYVQLRFEWKPSPALHDGRPFTREERRSSLSQTLLAAFPHLPIPYKEYETFCEGDDDN